MECQSLRYDMTTDIDIGILIVYICRYSKHFWRAARATEKRHLAVQETNCSHSYLLNVRQILPEF